MCPPPIDGDHFSANHDAKTSLALCPFSVPTGDKYSG